MYIAVKVCKLYIKVSALHLSGACRCAIVRFSRINDQDILSRLLIVCEKEKV